MVRRGYRKSRGQHDGLTDREREVLLCLASGMTTVEVGEHLDLSRQRVSQLVQRLDELGYATRRGRALYVRNVRVREPVDVAEVERELAYEAAASRDGRMTVEQAVAALVRAGVVSVADLNERQP